MSSILLNKSDMTSDKARLKIFIGDISRILSDAALYEEYYDRLSDERRSKADKYKNQSDKARAVGAGVVLDHALQTEGLSERNMRYTTGERGKPYLLDHPDIFFSLSHSNERVMCVLAGCEVGCDVEKVKENKYIFSIAKRYFSDEERAFIEYGDDSGKDISKSIERFFKVWTLKESFIKYTGEGLGRSLSGFSVVRKDGSEYVYHDHTLISLDKNEIDAGLPLNGSFQYAVCIGNAGLSETYDHLNITKLIL